MDLEENSICVVGASNIDIKIKTDNLVANIPLKGDIEISPGGVGYNISLGLSSFKMHNYLFTSFSNDILGEYLLHNLEPNFVDSTYSSKTKSSLFYCKISDSKHNYEINGGDISTIDMLSNDFVLSKFNTIIFDLNISEKDLESIINLKNQANIKMICDATSAVKCCKILKFISKLSLLKVNYDEALKLTKSEKVISIQDLIIKLNQLSKGKILLTLGHYGLIFINNKLVTHVYRTDASETPNTIGAGDAVLASYIYCEHQKMSLEETLIFSNNIGFYYVKENSHLITENIIHRTMNDNLENVRIKRWDI